jgi:hypothetical protein
VRETAFRIIATSGRESVTNAAESCRRLYLEQGKVDVEGSGGYREFGGNRNSRGGDSADRSHTRCVCRASLAYSVATDEIRER